MIKRKEKTAHRKMRVVRSWISPEGVFRYFTVFSDGQFEPATRREARQYTEAYGEKVATIVGEPEEKTWAMTTPASTGK